MKNLPTQSLLDLYYPESRFGGFTAIDGTIAFYVRVNALIDDNDVVLDAGCGRGGAHFQDTVAYRRRLRNIKGRCRKIIGIDIDAEAMLNPTIDEFHLINANGTRWPVDNDSVDVILADYVLEHVSDIGSFFGECQRVLKSGGTLCIRTTNRLSYVGLMARLIPNSRHASVLRKVQGRREERDVFPTLYRANTPSAIRRTLSHFRFEHTVYTHEAEPGYLNFSKVLYSIAVVLHKLIPNRYRSTIFAFARKLPGGT